MTVRRLLAPVLALAAATTLAGQEPHAALLAADRAASEASSACGFACALAGAMDPDALYLHEGMPVLQGGEMIGRFLRAQSELTPLRIQWQPLHAEVSSDGTFGVTWGTTTIGIRGGPVRFGHYLTGWRRHPHGWRIVAHVQTALGLRRSPVQPDQPVPALAPLLAPPALAPMAEADRAFAAQAGRDGAAAAFAAFAAADAVTFAGSGELVRGPEAIRASLAGGPAAQWAWGPVALRGADDGSLGITVGEATISVARPGGAPPRAIFSKYLTAWRREPSGAIRFIADAGNARPAP